MAELLPVTLLCLTFFAAPFAERPGAASGRALEESRLRLHWHSTGIISTNAVARFCMAVAKRALSAGKRNNNPEHPSGGGS